MREARVGRRFVIEYYDLYRFGVILSRKLRVIAQIQDTVGSCGNDACTLSAARDPATRRRRPSMLGYAHMRSQLVPLVMVLDLTLSCVPNRTSARARPTPGRSVLLDEAVIDLVDEECGETLGLKPMVIEYPAVFDDLGLRHVEEPLELLHLGALRA